jgi:hypothetical protein
MAGGSKCVNFARFLPYFGHNPAPQEPPGGAAGDSGRPGEIVRDLDRIPRAKATSPRPMPFIVA